MFLPNDLRDKLYKLTKKVFIVRAPIVLKHSAEDGIYGEVVDGVYQEADLSSYDIYGMRLQDLAKHSEDGYAIFLYNNKDLKKLYDTLEELIELIDYLKNRRNIRFTEEMETKLNSLDRLANTILKRNRSKLTTSISMKDMMDEYGFISPEEMKQNLKKRNTTKRKRIKYAGK